MDESKQQHDDSRSTPARPASTPSERRSAPRGAGPRDGREIPRDLARDLLVRGLSACVAGIVVGAALAARPPWTSAGPLDAAALGGAVGLGVFATLFPWRALQRLRRTIRDLQAVASSIRQAIHGQRDRTLDELLPCRDDALGPIVDAAREALVHSRNSRRERLMIERTMDHSIQRATEQATKRLRVEAATDPLTGLGNRRLLDAALAECVRAAADRGPKVIAALAIDLDHFKAVNDTLGHEAGDACLAYLGHLLRSTIRAGDVAVRLGGDEFVVILPDTDGQAARRLAERLRELYRKMPWSHGQVAPPTISIGVATVMPTEPDAIALLLRRADEALYSAKDEGRDSVAA